MSTIPNKKAGFKPPRSACLPFQSKTVFHHKLSTEAAKEIPDQSLDFVYIDARHDYCGALEDIENYWPKLHPGGIMAGDDYITNAEI